MLKYSYYDRSYLVYDPNPLPQWNPYAEGVFGKDIESFKETNSCTVVALSVATGNSYSQSRTYLSKFGRQPRKGMLQKDICLALESMKKFKAVKGEYSRKNRITVNRFIKKHPVGTYYVANRGHAFVIKDGVLYDHSNMKRRQILCAYRIYNQKELQELRNARNK